MKLKFKTQDFQTEAVNAVADLFAGQDKQTTTFSIVEEHHGAQISLQVNEFGVGNAISIQESDLLINMNKVQKQNNLPKTQDLYLGCQPEQHPKGATRAFAHYNQGDRRFCIEMETGTGKTYVYTKTIFELNRRYGFTKFIIVVPCRFFIYNSAKLSDVRQFATSSNIDAFKKAENIISLLAWLFCVPQNVLL